MKIIPKAAEPVRTEPVSVAKTQGSPYHPSAKPAAEQAPRSDQVQISDAGRAMAERAEAGASPISEERVSQIRSRILEGAYNQLDVVDEVARRILDSGDI